MEAVRVIARSHGEELAEATGNELEILPGCAHAYGYARQPQLSEEAMLDVARRAQSVQPRR